MYIYIHINVYMHRYMCICTFTFEISSHSPDLDVEREVGSWGRDPKKMYGERLGDGVEYHLMSPTPRR